ncbi:Predicted metalloprotease, contains C-terminal PDZ domain [Polynucleobacter meluiroseus]|uniref:Predicted metalloprotease, contains C-terminal PDZ domain n=1 Tax=Polynucleobacter meluiroseus TaxID=1938814 RepID=A0A240E0H0_9BURK|nr:PDZ domain-containing protein [Polynucleobacter meluiroseus]SNX28938.1 Predicted metalloprotease, contains C-terminal PDZ domain [Polynucleobacter meluiroseus]
MQQAIHHLDMPAIQYTVWLADLHGHRFHVKLRIENPNPDGQQLQMPAWIPGSYLIRDFSKHIESIKAYEVSSPTDSLPLERIDNDQWLLPKVSGPVEVLTTVYAFDSSVRAAFLNNERAFFNASSLCLSAQGQEDLPCALILIPPNDSYASGWSVQTGLRSVKLDSQGYGFYLAKNYDDLLDHPVAFGDFQLAQWQVNGVPHTMAVQGCLHPINLQRIAKDLQAICACTIALFEPQTQQAPFQSYLFLVNAVLSGYGGLEHRNSTALLCKRDQIPQLNVPLDEASYREFLGLCSHEYFHAWLVKRIQPTAFQPYQLERRNHTRLLWLFEGFTSYYDELQLFRSQRIDLKSYLKLVANNWNTVLRGPGRHKQSVADSSFDAWTKYYQVNENTPNAVVSYYGKGALLALGLDLKIREFTHNRQSLDDLMRLIWDRHGRTHMGIAEDGLDMLILELLGNGFTQTWNRFKSLYIFGVEDIPLQKWFDPRIVLVKTKLPSRLERNKLQLGLRYSEAQGWLKLTHVLDGGALQVAGLAPGDLLASINGQRVTAMSLDRIVGTLTEGKPFVMCFYRDDLEQECMAVLAPHQLPIQYELLPAE